jgi:hypothetical protein
MIEAQLSTGRVVSGKPRQQTKKLQGAADRVNQESRHPLGLFGWERWSGVQYLAPCGRMTGSTARRKTMGLFDWFRKKQAAPPAPAVEKLRFTPLGGELDRAIESVAVLIEDQLAFRAKAKEVAARFGPEVMPELRQRFHRSTAAPPGFTAEERGLVAWLSHWQFAIFEIVYQYREHALPMLREVAFGGYDWTQANAIELLCRLAAEGTDRNRTLADLKREMPGMRDTALLYVAGPLLQQAQSNPALGAIVEELQQVPEFRMAIDELQEAESQRHDQTIAFGKPEWQGIVVRCERREETVWNQQVIANCLIQGLPTEYPLIKDCGGSVQARISTRTQIEKLVEGNRLPAAVEDLSPGTRVEIGFFSFTEQASPVAIYPDSLLVLC